MNLVQIDVIKRLPLEESTSGWYYWSSVYYADSLHWPNLLQVALAVVQLDQLLATEDVGFTNLRIKDPPGRGNVVLAQDFTFITHGAIASEDSWSFINVARWRLFDDLGRMSYRLNRMPLRPSDMDGDHLSASGMTRQLTSRNTLLGQGWARNSHGALLTSGVVVPRLTMWQLRHGTKRRSRNPVL